MFKSFMSSSTPCRQFKVNISRVKNKTVTMHVEANNSNIFSMIHNFILPCLHIILLFFITISRTKIAFCFNGSSNGSGGGGCVVYVHWIDILLGNYENKYTHLHSYLIAQIHTIKSLKETSHSYYISFFYLFINYVIISVVCGLYFSYF